MMLLDLIGNFYDVIDIIDCEETLTSAILSIMNHMGLEYFAITDHGDLGTNAAALTRLHNYPPDFAHFHETQGWGARDPVHRFSQLRGSGFLWSALPDHLPDFTADDQGVFNRAELAGIGPGYTVPYHVPGHRSGSCSFAAGTGALFPKRHIPLAQSFGSFALEALRTLQNRTPHRPTRRVWLTKREREIVVLLGHGKQAKQIARLLRISHLTVNDHLKIVRERFGVEKSSLLVVCGLLIGAITYSELPGV